MMLLATGLLLIGFVTPVAAEAALPHAGPLDLTGHWVGQASLIVFLAAFVLVMFEELLGLRKSKPMILAAGIIWVLVAHEYVGNGMLHTAEVAARRYVLEYAELFLFLLVGMTYVNALSERRVLDCLRARLVSKRLSYHALFWLTGLISFLLSPIADNLTTALVMGAIVMTMASRRRRDFVALACTNIVVAVNAGGAFSPFGDITTLMVWQRGVVEFWDFFRLFVPALVNWLVPATIMSLFVSRDVPKPRDEHVAVLDGGYMIALLFLLTVATAVFYLDVLNLPPVLGMMTGLAYLQFFGYYLKMKAHSQWAHGLGEDHAYGSPVAFDVFNKIARAEWDTLLFFFGVVLAVGGLGFIGYLDLVAQALYVPMGPTVTNIAMGVLSAIVDNVQMMFAVLTMNPSMDLSQWLLVTLTTGVGGSLLSIGSAAGVAVMGLARGYYTFAAHLKWSWAVALGYVASVWVHLLLNGS